LFDEAGLEYPAVDWTTDDFLDYAVQLTQGEGEMQQYGYVSDLFEPSDMLNMMDRLGARLIDDGQDPPHSVPALPAGSAVDLPPRLVLAVPPGPQEPVPDIVAP